MKLNYIKLDEDQTLLMQFAKIDEEVEEFKKALINGDTVNTIEEFYDIVRAAIGCCYINNINLQQLKDGEELHILKLKKRGWQFLED